MQPRQHRPLVLASLALGLSLALLAAPVKARAWTWPVAGPVLQGFVFTPEVPLVPGQHRGIDIEGPPGGQVHAPVAGTVTFVGTVAANGLTVTIQTGPDGYAVTLLHLGSSLVRKGMMVGEGQPVAIVGTSGVPEHPVAYVHLGLRLLADPDGYVDPVNYLPPLDGPAPDGTPPPPDPEAQPVPVPPPAPAPPPTGAPPPPPATSAPRTAVPDHSLFTRPIAQADPVLTPVAPPSRPSPAPHAPAGASGPTPAAVSLPSLELRPVDLELARMPRTAQGAPARQLTNHPPRPWLRAPDAFAAPSGDASARAVPGPSLTLPASLALLAAVTATLCLCARRFRQKGARIIDGDALLPDHADLLREREPAHRARVHDHRRRRARTAPQAAR